MGNKSKIPLRIDAPKRGDRIKAKDISKLSKAIKRISSQSGQYASSFSSPLDPFRPTMKRVNDNFFVAIAHGAIIERVEKEDTATNQTREIIPEKIYDEENDNLPVWHAIEQDQAVYVRYETDSKGKIKDEPKPEIIVEEDDIVSVNAYPPVGSFAGQDGIYYIKLAKLTSSRAVGNSLPELEMHHAGSNIFHIAERVEIKNLPESAYGETPTGPDTRSVIKEYIPVDDTVTARSLQQKDGDGEPIIIPLGEGESQDTKEIIEFTRIAEKETGIPQVNVSSSGGIIRIEGNGYDASAGGITVVDGLVTDLNPDGAGIEKGTGNLKSKGYEESTPTTHIEWEDGFVKTNGTVTIKDKDVEPQVTVKSAAGTVTIEGNGYDAEKSGTIVKDGLVVQLGGPDYAGTGSFDSKGYAESTPIKHIEWEDGIITTNGTSTIKDKDVNPQVTVKSSVGSITIEGNGYNASAGGITVEDGLVTYLNPTGGGCEDGGTGSISLIEEGASTGISIAEWIDGCVKTNGDVQIVVREIDVCIDGVVTPIKFLTIDAMPTTPPP